MSGPHWWDELAAQAVSDGHETFSAAWYRSMRDQHLARFPDSDERTRANMRQFVEQAERRDGIAVQLELPASA